MKYVVEISNNCWLAHFDTGGEKQGLFLRTSALAGAKVFDSAKEASDVLVEAKMRVYLPNAVIRPYSLVEDECVQAGKSTLSTFCEKVSEQQTENWLKYKLFEYGSAPQKTSLDLLVDTVEAIEQYLANRDSLASKSVLESCLKHNKMFLEQIGR